MSKSVSNATWLYWAPPNVGLVNRNGSEVLFGGEPVPGQTFLYAGPSKSSSAELMQPVIFTSNESLAGRHRSLSSSGDLSVALLPLQVPSSLTALQYSKCPISSETETLRVCEVHSILVCGVEVEYIGWNVYGL